eukprot:CAMPEP_0177179584 /NCGR_PEP_ID=MMETSP0367-20130122/14936_1 /TAXON_ID=447022 ORGANISM="Scrippsiella hangoei-like, Strain SHHI-4" /NCGR_SAMPLE_ID=MMETSP0367 /ASSEMBLY_ACC=CAM_ASM_000362 /LENGTH=483 /DNA_ID=CAMNT_0018626311 /DNA_START=62 /DNA_END=1513 /DNA_ORIENTATION=+
MARAIGMLLGMFYDEEGTSETKDALDELRLVVERAETAGVEEELVETVRTKLAELEREVNKELRIVVRHSFSGELLTMLRMNPKDTAANLCALVHQQLGDVGVALRIVFGDQLLEHQATLADAGVCDGDTVFIVQTPLRCLTASLDGTARIHELQRGECHETMIADLDGQIVSASLSPISSALLTVSSEGRASLWCSHTGQPLCELRGEVMSCSFAADGRSIVSVSDDGVARIWCSETGVCMQKLQMQGQSLGGDRAEEDEDDWEELRFAAFSPNSDMIVTCRGKVASVWEAKGGKFVKSFYGHGERIKFAAFSPDGLLMISASADATARIWDVASGECLRVLTGHTREVLSATFSPNGERMLTASYDGTVRIWDFFSGDCTMSLPADNNVVNSAMFSFDGSMVLVASGSEIIRLFSSETGECCMSLSGHEDWVRSAAFSPDGMLVASASYDNTARIWNILSGECVKVLVGHTSALVSAEIVS